MEATLIFFGFVFGALTFQEKRIVDYNNKGTASTTIAHYKIPWMNYNVIAMRVCARESNNSWTDLSEKCSFYRKSFRAKYSLNCLAHNDFCKVKKVSSEEKNLLQHEHNWKV